jgi:ferredoxin--NADP+ reductase
MDDADWETRRKAVTLKRLADNTATAGNKRIVFRFLSSPVELLGQEKVEQILVVSNHLIHDENGRLQARPTEKESLLDTSLVLRAIGYRGTPFPGLPFNDRLGVIANEEGRVSEQGAVVPGVYVAGWIKRGAKGVIGSNKKCARDTVKAFFEDVEKGLLAPSTVDAEQILSVVKERQPQLVDKKAWMKIDRRERTAGRDQNRPRIKMTSVEQMLAVAADAI